MKKNKKVIIIIGCIILLFCISCFSIAYLITRNTNSLFSTVKIINYDSSNDMLNFDVLFDKKLFQQEIYCNLSSNGSIDTVDQDNWIKATNNKCSFNSKFANYYVFLRDSKEDIIEIFKLSDYIDQVYVFDTNLETLYLALNSPRNISYDLKYLGENKISWIISDDTVVKIEDNQIFGLKDGKAEVIGKLDDKEIKFNVVVSSLITAMPKHFNYGKKYLPCNVYNSEQADLIDEILFSRVEEAGGYETRAAVVAAARFLTLELPYRIDYFFENGRVSGEGVNYADGEGRYYHRGLYLNNNKFSTIKYTFAGPVIWGCPLMNYEDFGWKYVSGRPNSNGLDCSGFVSWAIYNGGFDVGDRGAGETPASGEMTDLGERVKVTKELIDSNTVKAGDLVNWWGHIGILIGIDDSKYYVAESLDTYEGLVIKEYKKEEMPKYWTFIMKMDSVYKEDGNYTAMWY